MFDLSVYPDVDPRFVDLSTPSGRADYVQRVCGAWDFGIPPTTATVDALALWREVFDGFPILDSPAYHAFRMLYGWALMPGGVALETDWERLDRAEGRASDATIA